MSWKDLSSAPPPGAYVCVLDDIRGAVAVTVETGRGKFPLIIVQTDEGLCGYVNACPHQYLPLDYRSRQILSADGARLMCSNHGARFDAKTGEGAAGALDPVPLRIVEGSVLIGTD